MKRDNRVIFRGNRFNLIVAATFAMTVFAFVCGAFLALQTSEKSSPSITPEVPISSPKPSVTPKSTSKGQPKKLPTPATKQRIPPTNTKNKQEPNEDRD
jgi:hypothetical protein